MCSLFSSALHLNSQFLASKYMSSSVGSSSAADALLQLLRRLSSCDIWRMLLLLWPDTASPSCEFFKIADFSPGLALNFAAFFSLVDITDPLSRVIFLRINFEIPRITCLTASNEKH